MPNQFFSPEGDLENYFVTEHWLIDQWVGDELWAWGTGTSGQLGNALILNRSTPVTTRVGGTGWKQISAGSIHTAAIKTDGTLWMWGSTGSGRLGNGATTGNISTPITTFLGGTNWKQVNCGDDNTQAIKTDGTLWTWGYGPNGALGNAQITNRSTPVTTFLGGTNWKQVSSKLDTGVAIKTDGTLWTWGSGTSGQLGNATTLSVSTPVTTFLGGNNWKQASMRTSCIAIKTDGTLWTWGSGTSGQLGNGQITNRSTPVTTFLGGTNWKQCDMGISNVSAIKTDGTLWLWGSGGNAQLGNGVLINRSTPVTTFLGGNNWKQSSTINNDSAAIKTDGTLWTWGGVSSGGDLGNGAITGFVSTPVTTFLGGTNWKQVSCGSNYMVAVKSGITAEVTNPG